MLRIGVLGAGHLGKIHLTVLKNIARFEITGFYDPDPEKSEAIEKDLNIKSFPDMDSLMNAVDAVDIVTPTLSHYDCAIKGIEKGKHLFIEKPLTKTLEEAEFLLEKAKGTGLKIQVGHVERFNPAFLAVSQYELNPLFIEGHRLAEFKPRGTDVSVVLDLMIHDIDIILSIVKSEVINVQASGVAVVSDNIDIANARIEFENGTVANLTASRMSLKTERKLRIFQRNAYITLDFFKKEANIFRMHELEENEKPTSEIVIEREKGRKSIEIFYDSPKPEAVNSIQLELEMFAKAILEDKEPPVSIYDGYRSLKLAGMIISAIEKQQEKIQFT
jgi:predicted dehydrogenase